MSRMCSRAFALLLACGLMPAVGESLFDDSRWHPLTSDNRAFRVGDVLTVQVFESSSAVTSADTGTRRSNNLQADLSHGSRSAAQASLGVGSDFDGGGRTQRASRLLTTVTVVVQEVLPNGQLRIAGDQVLTVNEELQRVTLAGLVRPLDIGHGNVVQSTRMADARITYVGEGDVSDRQRRAWWRRLFDAVGL